MKNRYELSRRAALQLMSVAGAGFCFNNIVPVFAEDNASFSDVNDIPLFIYCSFAGGWDTLLGPDPRDATDTAKYGSGKAINPGYSIVASSDSVVQQAMSETDQSGVFRPDNGNSKISVGPAAYNLAKNHWQDLCLVRGMNMGTLTHEVGLRYLLTGKFPRGLAANGSSLVTAVTNYQGQHTDLPNLVIGMENYNEDMPNWATGIGISNAGDILFLLEALEPIVGNNQEALNKIQDAILSYSSNWSCNDLRFNGQNRVTTFRESAETAQILLSGALASKFDYLNSDDTDTIAALNHFGIPSGPAGMNAMSTAAGEAFVAAQALTNGISQSVSIRLAKGIDHHDDDWETDHAPALRVGFDALDTLIQYLKDTKDPNGKAYWDRTTLIVSSEFARTPTINSRGGRDHHQTSSCIVAGSGIKGNMVIGGTDENYAEELIDLTTGAIGGSHMIRPPDVHATVLQSMGLSWDHISNQDPKIIEGMLA